MRSLFPFFAAIALLSACAPMVESVPAPVVTTLTHTSIPAAASLSTVTITLSPTAIPLPTLTPTATPQPTFAVLRGVVNQEHVNCYYGPSKAYLYKYGLLKGNRLDIIGIIADTGYIEVQAIGGNNPCWMNSLFMDVQGDSSSVKTVDPLTVKIPWSPNYPGLSYAKAIRTGNEVTITWSSMNLRPGDDSEQEPYLLETWVCRKGRLTFVPIGAYENTVAVTDEPGCREPSHGRVYGVEKHGYTKYLKFQWPQAEGSTR